MAAYDGPIVDVDIHNGSYPSKNMGAFGPQTEDEIRAYLPQQWRDLGSLYPPMYTTMDIVGFSTPVPAATTPVGTSPGASLQVLRDNLLDPFNYYRGVLTHNLGQFARLSNQYYASEVCRAANEWMLERWLSQDDRLYSGIIAASATPELAADEVRRLADHPKMVSVLLVGNPLGRPLGDPVYHPIYEAASEGGLSIAVHNIPDHGGQSIGGAQPTLMTMATAFAQTAMHTISSFIVHGVFERYPNLHLLIKEHGTTWLPGLIWRLDHEYDRMREESPWVKRWPSEYIHDHVRLSTQPIEVSAKISDLGEYLSVVDGIEDMLCFSTDYPHPTGDDPMFTARVLPTAWHRKVFCDNACDLYGWETPAPRPSEVSTAR